VYGLRIPDAVLLDCDLTPAARVLYGLLAASGPSFNPAISQIKGTLGIGQARIYDAMAELRAAGLVATKRTTKKIGKQFIEPTRYTVRAVEGEDVWVRPLGVRSIVEPLKGQSRVLPLLLHVYERLAVRERRPRPSIATSADELRISTNSVEKARRLLKLRGLPPYGYSPYTGRSYRSEPMTGQRVGSIGEGPTDLKEIRRAARGYDAEGGSFMRTGTSCRLPSRPTSSARHDSSSSACERTSVTPGSETS
jgi:hypothetical protein